MEVKALAEYNELSKEWDEIELIKDPWTLHNQTYSQKGTKYSQLILCSSAPRMLTHSY